MTFRCSDAARKRDDPIVGTAPPARRWVLIEQPAAWGPDALVSLAAPATIKAELSAALEGCGARLQLIRRPAARPTRTGAELSWRTLDTEPPVRMRGGLLADGWAPLLTTLREWASGGEGGFRLRDRAAARIAARHARLRSDVAPTVTDLPWPMLLICTNGRHDVCCAVRGRPVAAALETRFPGQVWECTHVGGDRFAANLVILPDGAAYGGLDPDTAVDVAEAHLRGEPDLRSLRGVTGRSPHDQAALIAVAGDLGVTPWDRDRLGTRAAPLPVGPGTPAGHRGWAREVLLDGDPAARIVGHDEISGAHQLTCHALAPSRALVPTVDAVEFLRL